MELKKSFSHCQAQVGAPPAARGGTDLGALPSDKNLPREWMVVGDIKFDDTTLGGVTVEDHPRDGEVHAEYRGYLDTRRSIFVGRVQQRGQYLAQCRALQLDNVDF